MRFDKIVSYLGEHSGATLTSIAADGSSRELTFGAFAKAALDLADLLTRAGMRPGHLIGILADNSLDWLLWDVATMHMGAALRPYPTHHQFDPTERIADHGLALLVTDRADLQGGPHVVPVDPAAFDAQSVRMDAPRSDEPDLHSVVCSSGTTGREKVLMISRAGAADALTSIFSAMSLGPGDRHLIFLPLTGLQQRQQVYGCLYRGIDVTLCAYQRVMPGMRSQKPTYLIGPPALYENILSVAQSGGVSLSDMFGGHIRFMITGMAPIRRKVMDAYWDAGLMLLEGYGLTECGIIACNTPTAYRQGTVGRPIDPEAFALSPEGEVIVRQRHPLSLGYVGADDLNSAVFGPSGEIHTGDIGHLDDDGFLILDGRIKDMIVLPNGKKLHPGDLESLLLEVPGVEDAVAVDNGSGVTAVLNVSNGLTAQDVRTALRSSAPAHEAAGAVTQIIFADIPLTRNPLFTTANMKLSRSLVGRHFLASAG